VRRLALLAVLLHFGELLGGHRWILGQRVVDRLHEGRAGVGERTAAHEQDQGTGRDQLLYGCSQTQYWRRPERLGWQSPKMALLGSGAESCLRPLEVPNPTSRKHCAPLMEPVRQPICLRHPHRIGLYRKHPRKAAVWPGHSPNVWNPVDESLVVRRPDRTEPTAL
jgi:hypothetical protein